MLYGQVVIGHNLIVHDKAVAGRSCVPAAAGGGAGGAVREGALSGGVRGSVDKWNRWCQLLGYVLIALILSEVENLHMES